MENGEEWRGPSSIEWPMIELPAAGVSHYGPELLEVLREAKIDPNQLRGLGPDNPDNPVNPV